MDATTLKVLSHLAIAFVAEGIESGTHFYDPNGLVSVTRMLSYSAEHEPLYYLQCVWINDDDNFTIVLSVDPVSKRCGLVAFGELDAASTHAPGLIMLILGTLTKCRSRNGTMLGKFVAHIAALQPGIDEVLAIINEAFQQSISNKLSVPGVI